MKLNTNISIENMIAIVVLLATVSISYGTVDTKIKIVKKYLFISFVSKLILEKTSLFINTFFGLLKERIWLIEYLVKEYTFKNLKPELVEKKDPPIITSKIYIKFKLACSTSREIPILEILLTTDKKLDVKLAS